MSAAKKRESMRGSKCAEKRVDWLFKKKRVKYRYNIQYKSKVWTHLLISGFFFI
jgi:hypothetical protein